MVTVMAKREEPKAEEPKGEERRIEAFGSEAYLESARAMREVGARVALSIGAAILIWLFGQMVFIPISKGMEQVFLGYPVDAIISFIFVITLAIIIFTIFIDIRRLTGGIAGVLAYQFGKASGEITVESFRHYRTALDGILYVIIVSLTYLLFAQYLGNIHPAIPAIVLILIVIWAIFALWRSCRAIAAEIGRYTTKWADELESRAKKA
jgi:polyferredoxin